jgi:hypothetical protein
MKILITESQLSKLTNKNSFFNVYHGTRSNIEDVLKGFYKDRELYGVLDKTFTIDGENRYGNNIIHYKVPNNGKFIIVEENTAKRYYGKNYGLKDQLMNCLGSDFEIYDNYLLNYINKYYEFDDDKYNQEYGFIEPKNGMRKAIGIERRLKDLGILNKIDGFIYEKKSNTFVIMQLYKTEIAIPYSYSTDGNTWTKI